MTFQYSEEDGRFVAKDASGLEVGEVTFTRDGDEVLVVNHTGVDPDYRGQGIAEELVRHVAEKAKNEGLKIDPVCSYAKKELERKPKYSELLKS
ncbi:GNAT family N-acetyltransferase [Mesobacillus jeotgali]|uniref:GNAT family N-acetyltransferase n=1 Tax=Mesobacillus jeotgali TaxID=129985 RepID=UPI0009A8E58C|nr:GNAT family N-acetyltransferase [Mesobacillus jeotgali]